MKFHKLNKTLKGRKFYSDIWLTEKECVQFNLLKRVFNKLNWKCKLTPREWLCPIILYKNHKIKFVYYSDSYVFPLNTIEKLQKLQIPVELCVIANNEIKHALISDLEYSNCIGYPVISPNQLGLSFNNNVPNYIIEYSPDQFTLLQLITYKDLILSKYFS